MSEKIRAVNPAEATADLSDAEQILFLNIATHMGYIGSRS